MNPLREIRQLNRRDRSEQSTRTLDHRTFESSDDNPLCQFCASRGVWEHLFNKVHFTGADWIHSFITDPEDVKDPERLKCPFCRLVFEVLPETAFTEEHRHLYSKDKTKAYCMLRPVRIKVRNEVFTSFAVTYDFMEYASFSNKVFMNYRAWIGLSTDARRKFNAPGIGPVRTPDLADPTLVRTWIDRCQRHHSQCMETHRMYKDQSWPTMMIDVRSHCIVNARTDYTYAALSYVWGQVRTLQATRANLISLMVPGALQKDVWWHQIPQVIRDAIFFTQSIGIPYLWVDCLCIVQDDYARKHDEIARMDLIYLRAQITIIPYSGANADVSIPGVRPGTRAMFSTSIAGLGSSRGRDLSMAIIASPEWTSLELDSVHESRAWTLQERVLSVRCVFLSRWGMWFQCLSGRYSDVEPGELPFEAQSSSDFCLLALEKPKSIANDDWRGWDGSRMDEFLSYAQHVEWYSSRKLTFQSDRMDAFRGILCLLEERCQQEFLWGHPEGQLLPVSLLWIHVDVGRSREATGAVGGDMVLFNDYLPDRDTENPTWSWLGWAGRVSYRLVLDMDDAGINMNLDDEVEIATQVAFDADDARERGVDRMLTPNLFHRTMNRGTLEVRGPSISTVDMCCLNSSQNMHVTTLDGNYGTFALMSAIYPYFKEGSLVMRPGDMKGEPCGAIFGIPFWTEGHQENHRFVLLKTVPGSVGGLFEGHATFQETFESAGDDTMYIALLIWVSGRYAERKGIAILDRAVAESRHPAVEEYFLL